MLDSENIPYILSSLTFKQRVFAIYMAKKLGYGIDDFFTTYFGVLLDKIKNRYSESTISVVDLLIAEKNAIEKLNFSKKNNWGIDFIRASEIENFVFCPISFAINRTFEVSDTELQIIGTELHAQSMVERLKIENQIKTEFKSSLNNIEIIIESGIDGKENTPQYKLEGKSIPFINESNIEFINELKNSTLIYPVTEEKNYINKEYNFVGKPDYIYLNNKTNEYFIVEEKFSSIHKNISESGYNKNNQGFYKNQQFQLKSYISLIDEIYISYGYLVKWEYEDSMDTLCMENIRKCNVMRISNSREVKNEIVKQIEIISRFIKTKELDINVEYKNAKKCAGCNSKEICNHKNRINTKLNLPYISRHNEIKIEYPDELFKFGNSEKIWLSKNSINYRCDIFKSIAYKFRDKYLPEMGSYKIHGNADWIILDNRICLSYVLITLIKTVTEDKKYLSSRDIFKDQKTVHLDWVNGTFNCYLRSLKTKTDSEYIEYEDVKVDKIVLTIKNGIVIEIKECDAFILEREKINDHTLNFRIDEQASDDGFLFYIP
ncbi:MAG: PD-(D/E)XK nuclease family protein [Bacteroidetes bacterium]|nr:PD-(D/E)XK nuclease family protein [Bacteroidota bacterium]